jgi:hypothetical protein
MPSHRFSSGDAQRAGRLDSELDRLQRIPLLIVDEVPHPQRRAGGAAAPSAYGFGLRSAADRAAELSDERRSGHFSPGRNGPHSTA